MAGLAPDGGLYMPERIPVIPRAFFNNISEMSIGDIAYVVATTMLGDDIDAAELKDIVFDTLHFRYSLKGNRGRDLRPRIVPRPDDGASKT